MADVTYNCCPLYFFNGAVDWDTDTIKLILVSSSYTPDQDTHTKRSDVTGEVTGTNWPSGGIALTTKTVTQDNTNNRGVADADDISVAAVTITGVRGGVVYKSRGGAASADEILRYVDFVSDKSSSGGTFQINWHANGIIYGQT